MVAMPYCGRMKLSKRTVGIIAQEAGKFGHPALTQLLWKTNMSDGDPGESVVSRASRANAVVGNAVEEGRTEDLVSLAAALLNDGATRDEEIPAWASLLNSSLRGDGLDAVRTETVEEKENFWDPIRIDRSWRIVPLGQEETPLEPKATALVRTLEESGLKVEANHFDQAYRAFGQGDWESSNAQLRATFEGVLIRVTAMRFGWDGDSGGQALDVLNGKKLFEKGEHDFLKGIWAMSHGNGSHPGLSNEAEALFRLNVIVAATQYVLDRFARPD